MKIVPLVQAYVKARGDGLGFPLGHAEFHFLGDVSGNEATVIVGGQPQKRRVVCDRHLFLRRDCLQQWIDGMVQQERDFSLDVS